MRILLLGGGGREHALAWKMVQSPFCGKLFIAPGNSGTALCGSNIAINPLDFEALAAFCRAEKITMLVPGTEEPLVAGIYDYFQARDELRHIPLIGPSLAGARLEGSKSFAKAFMGRHGIPTASYREYDAGNLREARAYLAGHSLPVVLKADGLASGKGVLICYTREEAMAALEGMLLQERFGSAGKRVVVEEYLKGIELSVFILTDGRDYLLLPEAKDYKRIGEGDQGLNTGGMGAISPVPIADAAFMSRISERIIRPTVLGLASEGIHYRGFLFFGLIRVGQDPYLIEYNCRLGDPETEVIIPRLKNDLVALFISLANQKLNPGVIAVDPRSAATVMLVSEGYPLAYRKGLEIRGLPAGTRDQIVFHCGTRDQEGRVLTDGGRVLSISSLAPTLQEALEASLRLAETIRFEGKYFRRDIGWEFAS